MNERKQQLGCCPIIRIFQVSHFTLAFNSNGPLQPAGPQTIEQGPCNTPLFGNDVICRSCRSGWEVEGNKFASEAEKLRATTMPVPAFKCYKPVKHHGKLRNVRSVRFEGGGFLYQLSGLKRDIPESALESAD